VRNKRGGGEETLHLDDGLLAGIVIFVAPEGVGGLQVSELGDRARE
jgi:hypothetical protein